MKLTGIVYLICFEKKFKHAKHYLGFTESETIDARLEMHKKGQGSKLLKAVNQAGIGYEVSRVWADETRGFERSLKKRKNSARLCPCCNKKLEHLKFKQNG